MRSVVYYATRRGNTRRVAEAVAEGLRHASEAKVLSVEEGLPASPIGSIWSSSEAQPRRTA